MSAARFWVIGARPPVFPFSGRLEVLAHVQSDPLYSLFGQHSGDVTLSDRKQFEVDSVARRHTQPAPAHRERGCVGTALSTICEDRWASSGSGHPR